VVSPMQRPPTDYTQHLKETYMPPAVFESAIPASERKETHALDCATTAINGVIAYLIQTRLNQIT